MFDAFVLWLLTYVVVPLLPAATPPFIAVAIAYTIVFATVVGVSMGVSRLLTPKMPSMSDLNDRGTMTRTPTGPRQIIYGQSKVSGPIVYLATSGNKNEYLHIVVALAGHEVQEIGDVYFNEDLVLTGSGDGYATGKYAASGDYDGSLIHKHLGTSTQTVDTTLQTDFPTDWDSNHRLRGIAYIYCKLTFSNEIFVGGIPNISCVVKGKKVYNPDTLTTAYSANPALCLRDYLTDADLGMGMDTSEIDDTSVIAAAAICVEQVEIKPVTTPATNENRYECNGQVVTSSTPDSIIGQILSAMAGTIAYSGGQVVVYAAAYRAPSLTLDETHMAGAFTVSTRTSARDRVNAVKGTYISEANQWTAADFPQITSATYLADDDGIYHWCDVILPFTTSSSAAQRIAVINLRQAREEIIFTAKFNLTAMQLRAGDTVMLTNANLGFSAKEFQVIAWSLASDGTPPTPVIELQLRETASSIYDWNVTDEIAVEGAPNTNLPSPFSIVAPTNLTLTADGTTQLIQSDGTALPRIKVAWSAPSDQFVQSGGKTIIEYKENASTTYLTWSTVDGDQTLDFISSDVRIGTRYNVRLFAQSFFNTSSTYTSVSSITVVRSETVNPPTSVASTTASGYMDGVAPVFDVASGIKYFAGVLTWTKSTSTDVAYYEMRTTAGGGGPILWKVDATQNSQWYYGAQINVSSGEEWQIRAVSRSGASSTYVTDATFPAALTITYGTADMAEQASSSVAITGGSTIGQSAVGATNFFANDASSGISGATTAADVQNANFRVFSGTTQKLRIDYTNGEVFIQSSRVLSTRKTGWSTATGTATRTTFATSTVTTEQLAERMKALIDDLHSTAGHGLIGT